jgi:Fe-S-cluster formation regulator IscX/YfhJ
MDWKALKDKALELKDKAVTASMDVANKAVDFADKNMKNTAIALKNMADYEKVRGEKILVIIVGNVENTEYKKLIAKMPLFLGYAWAAGATLRTCDTKESPDVAVTLEITVTPTLLVFKK